MEKKQIRIISIITIFAACLPLFTVNCIGGHDIAYHLLRIESLKIGIENGLPFLRVNMLFFGGEGYASSLFYPDLFLYLPALLRVAGVGINLSYNIFIAFCIIAGFISAYYCMHTMSKDTEMSLIAAIIFTLFKYHIYDIYTRGAVGEITAMIFLPFVIAGLYDLIFNEFKKPWLIIAGMSGVILCHSLTAFFCLVLCIVTALVFIKRLLKDKKVLLKLLFAMLAVVCITAFYVFPMLEMMFSADFDVSGAYFDLGYEKLLLKDIFEETAPSLGLAIFIPLLLRIFIKKDDNAELLIFADVCMIFGLIAALFTTGFLPWDRLMKYFASIQFPWRLFIMAGSLLAVSNAVYIMSFVKQKNFSEGAVQLAVVAVLAVMSVSALNCIEYSAEPYYSYSDDYFDFAPFTGDVIGGEWLPKSVTDRDALISEADKAFTDKGEAIPIRREKNRLYAGDLPKDAEYIDVPFVFYKGYAAADENGNALVCDGGGENGRVRVYTAGTGDIGVYYKGTGVQRLSWIITLCFFVGFIIYIVFKNRNNIIFS